MLPKEESNIMPIKGQEAKDSPLINKEARNGAHRDSREHMETITAWRQRKTDPKNLALSSSSCSSKADSCQACKKME